MKYYVFDQKGALLNSFDTRTQTAAYVTAAQESQVGGTSPTTGTGTTGETVSATPKAILPTCTFWTGSDVMPTSFASMAFPVVNYGGANAANMFGETQMSSKGYVSSLAGCINGSTNNSTVYFQIYKNGKPFGVVASGSSNGNRVYPRTAGSTDKTFVAGDVLGVYIRGETSSINQSFSANIEVTFTA